MIDDPVPIQTNRSAPKRKIFVNELLVPAPIKSSFRWKSVLWVW